jgi:predicted HAD superfamily hydrolase
MIASFDVFDTVLSRTYAVPEDVHDHLGEKLRGSGLIQPQLNFVDVRAKAEAEAWMVGGGRRGATLEEIYAILAAQLNWDTKQMHNAMEEEIRLERDSTRPVKEIVSLIEDARQRGCRICYVSDMHLRGRHIRAMLLDAGLFEEGDQLFVSSDCAAIKGTGQLFSHVMKSLGVRPEELHHIGDNRVADYRGAKRCGIHASLYTRARLDRFERAMVKSLQEVSWRERSLPAVSKFTRLSRSQEEPESALWDILGSTIAPFVTGYALWLLHEAQRRGIEKLFFLARDMQIVHEVTSYLAKMKGVSVQCIYVHASRSSWQPAGYSGPNEFELFWLTDHLGTMQPDLILGRLLSPDAVERTCAIMGSSELQARNWTSGEIGALLESEPVRSAVDEATQEARRLLLAYLAQCGYTPTRECALVDSGWRGSLQKSLAKAYQLQKTGYDICGFYIGLRHVFSTEPGCKLIPYLPDKVLERSGYSLISLIESMLLADHGTTVAFLERNGVVEPVLGSPPSTIQLRQWRLVRDSCTAYAQEFHALPAWNSTPGIVASSLPVGLLEFSRHPLPAEARLFERWFLDAGRATTLLRGVAHRLTMKDVAKLLVARLTSATIADVYLTGSWTQGSVACSPAAWRAVARLIMKMDGSDVS